MSDFTVDDTMVDLRYELDDREIYNDVRSEIGILTTETMVDADATYSWKVYARRMEIPATSQPYTRMFSTNLSNPISWKIGDRDAKDEDGKSYYDYDIKLLSTDDSRVRAVEITNTGSFTMHIYFEVKVKYKTSDTITHEESVASTLSVRDTSSSSITKYGRRVMNLTWTEGTSERDMQSLVEHYITRYAEPVARLICVIKGSSDALRTQIITREISDLLTVNCTELGLSADCFINSISISDDPAGIPSCTWELEIQRTYELLTLFKLGISKLGGAHVLGH